jgi:hypothetical protein
MPLTIRLNSPAALYRKLERELYRAFHASTPLHKADHFFNFCVTAASMRDYVLEELNKVTDEHKRTYYDDWNRMPYLVAAVDIANSSKHFILRNRTTGQPRDSKTRGVREKRSAFVDVYENSSGKIKPIKTIRTEIRVTLSDGQTLELYAFTHEILRYWNSFLKSQGIKVRRQPFGQLAGW